MSVSKVSVSSRVETLREKHRLLSEEVEKAHSDLSTADYYLSQIKKQKLMVKQEQESAKSRVAS